MSKRKYSFESKLLIRIYVHRVFSLNGMSCHRVVYMIRTLMKTWIDPITASCMKSSGCEYNWTHKFDLPIHSYNFPCICWAHRVAPVFCLCFFTSSVCVLSWSQHSNSQITFAAKRFCHFGLLLFLFLIV